MAVGQNLVHLVNIKIAGKWMFIPLKMLLIGIDPYPYEYWHAATVDNAQTTALLPNPDMGAKALAARPSAMPRELAEPMGPSKLKMISVFHEGLTENLEWLTNVNCI